MAISFYGAAGNYFNCLGKLGAVLENLKSYQTTQEAAFINTVSGIVGQLPSQADIQAVMGSNYISQLNNPGSVGTLMAQIASQFTNRVVFDDNPRINQNLTQVNIVASLREIIRQMKVQGVTVQACTVSGTPTQFGSISTNVGNGIVNVSVYRPSDGLIQQNAFAETIQVLCNSDSYVGGETAGNEGFVATGVGNQSNFFAFDWPLGSNGTVNLSAIDGNVDVGSGNLLTNSGLNSWTSNVPDNFSLVAGTAGVNILRNTTDQYDGAACCQIVGDGTQNFNITQTFDVSTGTTGTLSPLTQYGFCCFMKRDGTAAASGTLTIDLINGATNAVIQDAGGNNNSFTIDLTALTASYVGYTGAFRLPLVLPASIKIRVRLTTLLTTGRSVYLDKMSLGMMNQGLYTAGPALSVHAGSTPFNQGDYATVLIANNRGGAADGVSTFQTVAARLLPMMTNNLILPYAASPSVPDSAIG